MKKLLIVVGSALAIAGCNVNVTSNDAETREALNDVKGIAQDVGNTAEELAEDAGGILSNAAEGASEEVQDLGNRVGDIDVDVNTDGERGGNGASGNKQ